MYVLTEQGTSSNVVTVKIDYLIIEGPKIHYLFIGKFKIGKANSLTFLFKRLATVLQTWDQRIYQNNRGDIKYLQHDQYEAGELCALISVSLQPKNSYYLFAVWYKTTLPTFQ